MLPANAQVRHPVIEERIRSLKVYSDASPLNVIEMGSQKLGISSGWPTSMRKRPFLTPRS